MTKKKFVENLLSVGLPEKNGVVALSFQRSMLVSDWENFEVATARVRVLEY